ncbi:MAG: hypothetical protein M3N47_06420, partial [Chloroflexota bacterium]|nr:hypothetical protein [Chloroflexota bacterium]
LDYQPSRWPFPAATVAHFDGSLIVHRTAGQVTATCDNEAANPLTVNLMHDNARGPPPGFRRRRPGRAAAMTSPPDQTLGVELDRLPRDQQRAGARRRADQAVLSPAIRSLASSHVATPPVPRPH